MEENLERLKETVADQKNKINDLDKKVDDLERALKKESKNPIEFYDVYP